MVRHQGYDCVQAIHLILRGSLRIGRRFKVFFIQLHSTV